MTNDNLQAAIKELKDAMVVMAHMESRQAERVALQAERQEKFEEALQQRTEWLVQHEKELQNLAEMQRSMQAESLTFQRRTEQNLAEITDKLNGLIGFVDGQRPN